MTHNNNPSNDESNKKPEYTVGYGKPPKESQWRRGQSGNPKGRAKGAKNLSTLIEDGLEETVPFPDKDGHKKISKKELYVLQIINKGIAGHQKFTAILHEAILKLETRKDSAISRDSTPVITPDTTDEEVEKIYKETLKNVTPTE